MEGINSNVKIYIPSNLEKQYKETPFWKTLANNFVVDDLKIMFARYARSQQQFQQLYSEYDDRNKSSIQEKLKRSIIDTIFPIGSLYITMNNLNPKYNLGGEWELLEGENTLWLTSGDKKLLSDDYMDLMPEASVQPGLPNILDEDKSPTLMAWDVFKEFVDEILPKAITDNWSDIQLKGLLSQWLVKSIANIELGGKPNSASGKLKFTTASLQSDFITNGLIGPIIDFLPKTFTYTNTLGIVRTFDASNCSPIYGNSDTVQPPAIRVYGWRRIG